MPAAMYLEATKNFLCGQVVSLFSLMALVMVKRLVYRDVNTPVLLNMCFYLALAIVYTGCSWVFPRSNTITTKRDGKSVKWWVFPILAIIDLEANVCATTSLQYVSFTTTGLTLNLAVPFVFTMTVFAFRASYKWKHCVGCLLTLAGAIVLVAGCYARQNAHSFGSENEVFGWSCGVVAAILYAGSTVINQWCVQVDGLDAVVELLSKVGQWGTIFCVIQGFAVERVEISAVDWNEQVQILVLGYVLCMFAFYTAVFVLVKATESTLYNLSLLFSGVYMMIMARNALDETVDMYTTVSMLLMLVGLGVYTWTRAVADGLCGGEAALPQISFKSIHTPSELVPNKLQLAQV